MKTNHRRKQPKGESFDYDVAMWSARRKVGLGDDHDGGRRGAAKDIREAKTQYRRQRRRREDRETRDLD